MVRENAAKTSMDAPGAGQHYVHLHTRMALQPGFEFGVRRISSVLVFSVVMEPGAMVLIPVYSGVYSAVRRELN